MCHRTDNGNSHLIFDVDKFRVFFCRLIEFLARIKMSVSLFINCAVSLGAFLLTKRLIPSLSDMFISANLFGKDMCKRDTPKMYVYIWFFLVQISFLTMFSKIKIFFFSPEAMGSVSGCIFLIALFLFIPVPFIFSERQINEFPHNQVQYQILLTNHNDLILSLESHAQ